MESSNRSVTTVEEFLSQVEQACSDLPEHVRKRLLVNLEQHLRETAETDGTVVAPGDPVEYARDLREAMRLQESTSPDSQIPPRPRFRRWSLVGGIGASAIAVAVALVIILLDRSGTPSPVVSTTTSVNSHTAAPVIRVPNVIGDSKNTALDVLHAAGLRVHVRSVYASRGTVGTVVSVVPLPGAHVDAGTLTTITISRRRLG